MNNIKKIENNITCEICPHNCVINNGKTGICGTRRNNNGVLIPESYGKITSMALDPIEKKPLNKFYPGSKILSFGSYGCNFKCGFCQNYHISTEYIAYKNYQFKYYSPEDIALASAEFAANNNIGVAYTYNEPLINYDFVYDCAKLIAEQGQKNVLVTNGYINKKPLEALLPYIHAANIDVKSFDPAFYAEIGGNLESVKSTVEQAAQKCHVEITVLIIPYKNDSAEEICAISGWLAGISKDIPLHITRFRPMHKFEHFPPTPVETILKLTSEAKNHLNYVYPGNI